MAFRNAAAPPGFVIVLLLDMNVAVGKPVAGIVIVPDWFGAVPASVQVGYTLGAADRWGARQQQRPGGDGERGHDAAGVSAPHGGARYR